MKSINFGLLILICSFCVIFTGCPYESDVPITEPYIQYPESLIGIYVNDSAYTSDVEISRYYEITKFSSYEFKVTEFSDGERKSYYIGHFTDLNGTFFLNLIDPESMKYKLYKYEITPDNMFVTLFPVTDYIKETFESSADLKAYIEKYMQLSFFYSAPEYYVKAINPIFKQKEDIKDPDHKE